MSNIQVNAKGGEVFPSLFCDYKTYQARIIKHIKQEHGKDSNP